MQSITVTTSLSGLRGIQRMWEQVIKTQDNQMKLRAWYLENPDVSPIIVTRTHATLTIETVNERITYAAPCSDESLASHILQSGDIQLGTIRTEQFPIL